MTRQHLSCMKGVMFSMAAASHLLQRAIRRARFVLRETTNYPKADRSAHRIGANAAPPKRSMRIQSRNGSHQIDRELSLLLQTLARINFSNYNDFRIEHFQQNFAIEMQAKSRIRIHIEGIKDKRHSYKTQYSI